MPITLAIIGLDQIGASIGMALAEHEQIIWRVGYDFDPIVTKQAQKLNVADKITTNLKECVADADLVILALPTDQIAGMMEEIGPLLKTGSVLMDTVLSKEKSAHQAVQVLPHSCDYVGLTPVINPAYLVSASSGGARTDLFHNGVIAISTMPHTDPKAIKLAGDLTRLLGASLLFADVLEIASHMAGRAYAEVSGPIKHLGLPGTLATTAV